MRTKNKPIRRACTSIVRLRGIWILALPLFLAACPSTVFGQPGLREEARGWLQLKSDQRTYRERAEPIEPRNDAYLQHLEQSQQRQFRALQSRQSQQERRERRRVEVRKPDRGVRGGPTPRVSRSRELERQRLNQRIQRETFGAGRW
jgi:hypothetical protein